MMKIYLLGLIALGLLGCSATQNTNITQPTVVDVFINNSELEDKPAVEQEYTSCSDEEAKKLVGQSNLTEAEIKLKTQAAHVRMVVAGSAVRADLGVNRVTVRFDPATKTILSASCS